MNCCRHQIVFLFVFTTKFRHRLQTMIRSRLAKKTKSNLENYRELRLFSWFFQWFCKQLCILLLRRHPYVTFFHLFFRGMVVVTYMLCGIFINSFITSFVFVVLLLSADFWTVKNITGRLLVGLRWWNYIDDDGQSHWVYESKKVSANTDFTLNLTSAFLITALFLFGSIWLHAYRTTTSFGSYFIFDFM